MVNRDNSGADRVPPSESPVFGVEPVVVGSVAPEGIIEWERDQFVPQALAGFQVAEQVAENEKGKRHKAATLSLEDP